MNAASPFLQEIMMHPIGSGLQEKY